MDVTMKCVFACVALLTFSALGADSGKVLFENDFQKAEVDKMPAEFMVLEGAFGVKEEGGNRFLELPGAPLDTFGTLFGPSEKENVSVTARFQGTGKGRRFPTFGLGLNGVSGFRLQVSPAKKLLELYKGETFKTSVPYTWETGKWTSLRLQVTKAKDGEWKVAGKAWVEGTAEPADWALTITETEAPAAGRASVWGSPFATTPIRFDDLKVTAVQP